MMHINVCSVSLDCKHNLGAKGILLCVTLTRYSGSLQSTLLRKERELEAAIKELANMRADRDRVIAARDSQLRAQELEIDGLHSTITRLSSQTSLVSAYHNYIQLRATTSGS